MKKGNVIQEKSFEFLLEVISTYKYLLKVYREFVLSKQLLRSGTSIGANVEEALGAVSRRDFYYKISIAYKEARETKCWIRLFMHSRYLRKVEASLLLKKVDELCKILAKIQLSKDRK